MADISSKFRFGNLVVNLADGLRRCWVNTLEPKTVCGVNNSICYRSPLIDCAKIRTTYYEEYCRVGTHFDPEWWTPIIKEMIPQITEHESITLLKEDLKAAVELAEKQEATLTAAAKPQTMKEVIALQEKLTQALGELDDMKKQMQKKK